MDVGVLKPVVDAVYQLLVVDMDVDVLMIEYMDVDADALHLDH